METKIPLDIAAEEEQSVFVMIHLQFASSNQANPYLILFIEVLGNISRVRDFK